jgi:hypothetical protein
LCHSKINIFNLCECGTGPRLWLGDKLKGLKNTSDSNLEILLNSIKEGDEVIMDFNYTMTGRRDPTYLGVVFDIAKAQQQKPATYSKTKSLKVSTSNLFFLNFENDKASNVSFIALR